MPLLDLIGRDTTLRRIASTHGGEYAGPCPWCGGDDRFRVWPHADTPGYWCRHCGRKGDAIQYLRDHDGLSFQEACERVGRPLGEGRWPTMKRPPYPPTLASAPSLTWQAQEQGFIECCEQALWKTTGRRALGYLHDRGLDKETIRAAWVGYHASLRWDPREAWGLTPDPKGKGLWLPPGLVFPWTIGPEVWKVTIRRLADDIPHHKRHIEVCGSANTLYRVDTLRPNQPAATVEGVLDALSIAQEAGDLITAVAAETTKGRLERWIGRLGLCSMALLMFDADEAGEKAAVWWLKALGSRAKRWRPYWDDPSQMLQGGVDLRAWVQIGLGMALSPKPFTWREQVAHWPDHQQELWAERAAIMAVDGELMPDEAEQHAFALVRGGPVQAKPTGGGSPTLKKEDSRGEYHGFTA